MDRFTFELVSPERVLMSEPVRMAVIPGEEGDFGVLPGHSALVSAIRAGVVEVTVSEGQAPQRIFIAGGFADVTATHCTVLAEEAVNVNDLEATSIEQAINNLTDELDMAADGLARARIQKKIDTARARLNAAAKKAA
jgi:F-type H+-transporting ATPase subunit epsilon